jgi:biotin carboxyl carrier protein
MSDTKTQDPVASTRQQKRRSDLENILETTKPRGWWALAFISVSILIVGVWACVAKVPQTTSATGVVNALVYSFDITAPATGNITFSGIKGGSVTAGSTVGTIKTPEGASVPVVSGKAGEISSIAVGQNTFVTEGQSLITVSTAADAGSPVQVITFLGSSDMLRYPINSTVEISATDVVSGRTIYTTGQVVDEGGTPSTEETLNDTNGDLTQLTDQWMTNSSGMPYSVFITIDSWPSDASSFAPRGGLVLTITRTYDTIRPISWLFGGK